MINRGAGATTITPVLLTGSGNETPACPPRWRSGGRQPHRCARRSDLPWPGVGRLGTVFLRGSVDPDLRGLGYVELGRLHVEPVAVDHRSPITCRQRCPLPLTFCPDQPQPPVRVDHDQSDAGTAATTPAAKGRRCLISADGRAAGPRRTNRPAMLGPEMSDGLRSVGAREVASGSAFLDLGGWYPSEIAGSGHGARHQGLGVTEVSKVADVPTHEGEGI